MSYPDVLPHDAPKEIADNLSVVHGCVRPSAIVHLKRCLVDTGCTMLRRIIPKDEIRRKLHLDGANCRHFVYVEICLRSRC